MDSEWYKIIGDGAAYEVNIKGACNSPADMWEIVHSALSDLGDKLNEISDLELYRKPVINFDYARFWTEEYMNDKKFFWSTVFGCDEDKDAFNVDWLCEIQNASVHPVRYGGGHIHTSGDEDIGGYPLPFVKLLALFLGNYNILHSPYPTLEVERAKYYGKPGKYRIQNYSNGMTGVEYRTPSNAWLSYNYPVYESMFEMINLALDNLKNPQEGMKLLDELSQPTIEAITTANKGLSRSILSELGVI
jgi:hypothetical protein